MKKKDIIGGNYGAKRSISGLKSSSYLHDIRTWLEN